MKQCKKCGIEKEFNSENFPKRSSYKEGLSSTCKECEREKYKESYQKNKDKVSERGKLYRAKPHIRLKVKERSKFNTIKRKYGITKEQFNEMLERQDNCCAICQDDFNETNYACVDHIVIKDKIIVRGLLCYLCNLALGYLKEDVEIVQTACRYMEYFHNQGQSI